MGTIDLHNRVIIGGGGGDASQQGKIGCGFSKGGGGGGLIGGNGVFPNDTCTGGLGANQTGSTGSGVLGFGSPGQTEDLMHGGGGGGGGYWGGAGGSPLAGGGGGGGFGPTGTTFVSGLQHDNGRVEIVFDTPTTLTLHKQVVNGTTGGTADPRSWYLLADGPTDIYRYDGDRSITDGQISPGTYLLSEGLGTPGYLAASRWTCTGTVVGGARGNEITLKVGDHADCTITNTAVAPLLTLVKEVDHGDTNGQRIPQDWTLSAAGPVTITGQSGNPEVTAAPVAAGTYTLSETGPGGYTASAWSCSGGVQDGNRLTLGLGFRVTCTIRNTAVAPRLTLVKQVDNAGIGTATPDAWPLSASGLVNLSGTTGSPAVTDVPVKVGTYTLTESGGPPGYSTNGFGCDGGHQIANVVTLTEGDRVTCTILNTVAAPRLTLVKKVENAHGGTATARSWTLSATGPATVTGRTGDASVTRVEVAPGAYTLSESGGPAGYAAGAWSCTGGSLSGATLTLALTDEEMCTIVNRDQPGTLTLRKQVEGGRVGTTRTPADWTLTATPVDIAGQPAVTGNGADGVTRAAVSAGRYTLSESGPPGFTAGSWHCTGGSLTDATLTVVNGADVSCSITNTVFQQRLTLVKVVDNGSTGGTAAPSAWTLTASGPTPLSGASGSAAVTAVPVAAGRYALAESDGPPGYTPSAWMCTGGTVTDGTVTVADNLDVTCTITSTAQATRLTLVNVVVGHPHASARAWRLTAAGPVTLSGKSGTKAVTQVTVPSGSYVLTDSDGPHGYTTGSWVCDAGTLLGSTIQLPVGADATCTLTQYKDPRQPG